MKLKTLALATGIALSAMSAAGTAQASSLASSVLDITGFTLFKGGVQVDRSDLSTLAISNTADISTQLGATTDSANDNGSGQDLDLDPLRLGAGVPAYANNDYTAFGSPPVSTFSLSDQSQLGSPITGLIVNGSPIDPTATAGQAAYVSLLDVENGSTTANNGLNTSFAFALGEGGALDFAFDARGYLEAFTDASAAFPTAASAQFGLVFTLVDLEGGHGLGTNATIINWEPDGTANAGGASALGLTAETDPFDLTQVVSRNAPVNGSLLGNGVPGVGTAFSSSWSATSIALLAGNDYQLTIRSTTLADARTAVPEPATLALMGLGILGLGLSRRRRA